jgi:hypothetical protein
MRTNGWLEVDGGLPDDRWLGSAKFGRSAIGGAVID